MEIFQKISIKRTVQSEKWRPKHLIVLSLLIDLVWIPFPKFLANLVFCSMTSSYIFIFCKNSTAWKQECILRKHITPLCLGKWEYFSNDIYCISRKIVRNVRFLEKIQTRSFNRVLWYLELNFFHLFFGRIEDTKIWPLAKRTRDKFKANSLRSFQNRKKYVNVPLLFWCDLF